MRRHRETRTLTRLLLVCACVLFTGPAFAAPRDKAPSSLVPSELQRTDIRNDYVVTGVKEVGVIQTVVGHVVVAKEDLSRGYYAAPGDRIFEKDVLFTLKGSRCRFKLSGEDVVSMAENTQIGIKTFSENARTQTKQSLFSMAKGKAMFYALRLFTHRSASMQVETATAVCGVRGTKWGVEVTELDGKPTASLPIHVADLSDMGFRQLAAMNPPNFQTNIYSFEGTIMVTSPQTGQTTTLSGGQGLNAGGTGLGNPFPAPPGLLNQFASDTNVNGGGDQPPPPPPPGGAPPPPPPPPDTSGVTQQQNQQQNSETATRPTNHEGFFSVMLRVATSGYDSHLMTTVPQDFSSETIIGTDPFQSEPLVAQITADGTESYADHTITSLTTYYGISLDNRIPVTVSHTELGYNTYTEWGYWTQPLDMWRGEPLSYNYAFVNKGYYVGGDLTTDAQIAALHTSGVVGNYAGTAYGTHYINYGAVTDMTGTFSTTVNFATSQVSNFNIDVSGGGGSRSASITGASGNLGPTGTFQLTNGTVTISGSSSADGKSFGAVYGSSGQAVGGVWGIYGSQSVATGMFQGTR